MNKPLWQPSQQRIHSAQITRFREDLQASGCAIGETYAALHRWSVAVEPFVVSHYESQYAAVERFGDTELLATIQRFCNDEADHRDEAAGDVILPSRWLKAWCRLVSFGSEQAVGVARKL